MNKNFGIITLSLLILISGCANAVKTEKARNDLKVTTEDVLHQFGYPLKVQKYMNFEIWIYEDMTLSGTERCVYYFNKKNESGPAKCSMITRREPARLKTNGSRKVVINY